MFIQGADDVVTPPELARRYFERLAAPQKSYVALVGAGHNSPIDNTQKFLAAFHEQVRPFAAAARKSR